MKAALQFAHYHVVETIYKNGLLEPDPDFTDPKFSFKLSLDKDNINHAVVWLSVELGNPSDEHYVKAVIAGFFRFNSEVITEETEIISYYEINAASILFPYLRSLVSDLTSKGESKPVILPTINVHEMMQNSQQADSTDTKTTDE
ncbi:preprotein translocase subunit SecB [Bhargavaea ginsengi]|uniref:Preprotein translocase subunit SecB n=1 Tax=Bhargavaea ginsengi TaxID=426757 RepID=A0A1H7C5U7_9BACL|nr:protein-export chaperone SecB [Bhargavaea ginsengi]SEJ82432.1 preprotein translocase subunit SecB [Bhargavaea ginsengi]